jgi:hypothetical protein
LRMISPKNPPVCVGRLSQSPTGRLKTTSSRRDDSVTLVAKRRRESSEA